MSATLFAGARVDGHVRAAEAVDRLLGVAYEEEASRFRSRRGGVQGEAPGDLDLDGVSVLELIDEQAIEPLANATACRRLVSEQVAHLEDKVVEDEPAFGASGPGVVDHEAHHEGQERGEGLGAQAGEGLQQGLDGISGGVAGGANPSGPAPVALRADVAEFLAEAGGDGSEAGFAAGAGITQAFD